MANTSTGTGTQNTQRPTLFGSQLGTTPGQNTDMGLFGARAIPELNQPGVASDDVRAHLEKLARLWALRHIIESARSQFKPA